MRFFVVTALAIVSARLVAAAVFNVAAGDVTGPAGLKAAIASANSNGEDDTINLAAGSTYTLSSVDNTTNGPNGLPVITSDTTDRGHTVTINANGATIKGNGAVRVLQVAAGANVTITALTISSGQQLSMDNSIAEGGGVLNFGRLTLIDSTITGCYATGNPNLSGPGPRAQGGGLSNHGICTLNRSTLYQNQAAMPPTPAAGGDTRGGAIYNTSTLTLINSTIATNYAYGGDAANTNQAGWAFGGGIYNDLNGSVDATNCTIAFNLAQGGMTSGGGSTMAGNSFGGGVYIQSNSTFTILNTIVAQNTVAGMGILQGVDVYGAFTSHGHNLLGKTDDSTGYSAQSGDRIGNAFLGAFQDNGGPTATVALTSKSDAIDTGDDSVLGAPLSLTTDQRGLPRKQGGPVDIGAFEFDAPQPNNGLLVNTLADHDDGVCGVLDCTLREAISIANSTAGAQTITFASGLSGTITLTHGYLGIGDSVTIQGPGANVITIDANHSSRVLLTAANITVSISGLSLVHGTNTGSGSVAGQGGGIYNQANLTLTACALSGNQAIGGATSTSTSVGEGGAIYNLPSTPLTLIGCTFNDNHAYGGSAVLKSTVTAGIGVAGALSIRTTQTGDAAKVTIQNCTFSGNTAEGGSAYTSGFGGGRGGDAFGGAILDSGQTTITACTITNNSAIPGSSGAAAQLASSTAGGIFYNTAPHPPTRVGGTIIAGNNAGTGPDVNGSFNSQGFNLIGNTSSASGFTQTTDKTGDPLLQPLADNGGPTLTHALKPGSPAIDAANTQLATDQRGASRPYNDPATPDVANGSDIGAFEFGSTAPTPTSTPTPSPTATPSPAATATPTATTTPTATPTVLGNISTRLSVETGDNVLIGGFIVTGSQQKKVLIRAIGPSTGIAGALADPKLDLFAGQTLLEENDNWVDSPNKQAIIDTGIPPASNLESAIVRTLPANGAGYTAQVSGVNGSTGIGLVEVYDLDRSVDSKLANISTRGLVQTGDNVMIGGFIVLGQDSLKVLIRAIGPSTGVAGALPDPMLELRDKDGNLLQANDNWKTDQQAEIEATTIPPGNDLESALVRTVSAGNYTAIVRGANSGMGIALVEVYALN